MRINPKTKLVCACGKCVDEKFCLELATQESEAYRNFKIELLKELAKY